MGKSFTVDDEVLSSSAKKLEEISENYKTIAAQLMDKAQTMGAAWEAEDNLAFVTQITGFTEELNNMAAKLKANSQILELQGKNYKTHREDNVSQVKTLAN